MEWLLIFYFNGLHGSISTERLKTYDECQTIGKLIKKDSAMLSTSNFVCIEVKKLDTKDK